MNPSDQTKSPPPPPREGDDDLIELTEVVEDASAEAPTEEVEDASAEVVLDFRAGSEGLASLKSTAEPPQEKPEAPAAAPREESLDDFLASLPDLPEDLDITDENLPPQKQAAPDLPQELAARLSDTQLQELVRQVIQETVERLARELFPQMASEAIERELTLIKKRLTEPD
jgi:hypothetical protein